MKILYLKKRFPLAYKAAMDNQWKQNNSINEHAVLNKHLDAFIWSHTPEGKDFWKAIWFRNWNGARNLKPELMKFNDYQIF